MAAPTVFWPKIINSILYVTFYSISISSALPRVQPWWSKFRCTFENEEESPGISRGGVLNVVRHTIEVECRASEIPESITADLTGLDIGDSLNISAITLPEGVKPTIEDRDFTIATIAAPAVLGEEPSEEDEVDVDDVEVIGEAKDDDEEGDKE